jgi:hypothetical protein
MIRSLTAGDVLRMRMRSQLLSGRRPREVAGLVGQVCALQAQSTRDARLAVRARGEAIGADAVDEACNQARTVVRTWAMRGTLHMLAACDVRWVVDFYRPPAGTLNRRQRELGLSEALLTRALPAIEGILSQLGPLSRAELVRELAAGGIVVGPSGQAPAHLVGYAARQGLICRGPDRSDDEPTYALLSDWVGQPGPAGPGEALAELARRYLTAYAPAGPQDFASWAGLPLGRARRGFELAAGEFEEVDAAGERAWVLAGAEIPGPDGTPCVRLLPHFDSYLLGYRNRDIMLAPPFAQRIQAGGGWIRAAVVVDGRVAGTWSQQRTGEQTVVQVKPFEPLARAIVAGLESEAADLGRFQSTGSRLEIAPG